MKSKCCNDQLVVQTGLEGTSHWVCLKCGKPADAVPPTSTVEGHDVAIHGGDVSVETVTMTKTKFDRLTQEAELRGELKGFNYAKSCEAMGDWDTLDNYPAELQAQLTASKEAEINNTDPRFIGIPKDPTDEVFEVLMMKRLDDGVWEDRLAEPFTDLVKEAKQVIQRLNRQAELRVWQKVKEYTDEMYDEPLKHYVEQQIAQLTKGGRK